MTTVHDDTDLNLFFSGNWRTTGQPNANVGECYNQTYRASSSNGDFLEVRWTGGNIAVYGARQIAHGVYGAAVDGAPLELFSGFANPGGAQQAIFVTQGLSDGDHTLRLSNENARNVASNPTYLWLDVDFIAVAGQLRNANPNFNPNPNPAPAPAPAPSSTSSPPPPPPAPSTSSPPAPPPSSSSSSSPLPPSSSSAPTPQSQPPEFQASAPSSSPQLASSTSSASSAPSAASAVSTASWVSSTTQLEALSSISRSGGPSVRPVLPSSAGESAGTSPQTNEESGGARSPIVVAVSGTVTALSALTILTLLGLWLHRRKRSREVASRRASASVYGTTELGRRPDAAWARL